MYYDYVFKAFDDLFGNLQSNVWTFTTNQTPTFSVFKEKDSEYEATVLVAGLKKEDITIDYKKNYNYFTVTVEVKNNSKFVSKGKITFHLASDVDIKTLKASIVDGVLTLTVKKNVDNTVSGKVDIS